MKDGSAPETVTDVVNKFIRIKLFTQQWNNQPAGMQGAAATTGPLIKLKSAQATGDAGGAGDADDVQTQAQIDHIIHQVLIDNLESNLVE